MKCYVCVLSTNNYLEGVLVLKENLDMLKSKYKLICLINENITLENRKILNEFGIEYILFPNIKFDNVNENNPYWIYTFDKLNIFRLTDYEKIVYLDSDLLILENLDHLFKKKALSMPRDLPFHPDSFCSGVMVVEPNMDDYNRLVELSKEKNAQGARISDQDVINEYFSNINALDKEYNVTREVLNEETLQYDPIIWYPAWKNSLVEFLKPIDNPKIIHYIGKTKPFMLDKTFADNYAYLYFYYLSTVREKIKKFGEINSDDLISVIIPVYNKKKYLKKCLDSIIKQTYKKLEIILVDDCSTDNSLQICHEYAKKDSRIIVVSNKENRGVSYTRNVGIDIAKGKYISFIDADDYMEENMLEILHYKISVYEADFSQCSIRFDGKDLKRVYENDALLLNRYDIFRIFFRDNISSVVFDKLINRRFFDEGLRFNEDFRKHEDTFFVIQLLQRCEKICLTNDVLYNYEHSKEDSLTGNFNYEQDKNLIWIDDYLDSYIVNEIPALHRDLYGSKIGCMMMICNSMINNPKELEKVIDDASFRNFLFNFRADVEYVLRRFNCYNELCYNALALINELESLL